MDEDQSNPVDSIVKNQNDPLRSTSNEDQCKPSDEIGNKPHKTNSSNPVMNRYQSNPFLADWEPDESRGSKTTGLFDNDDSKSADTTTRRHSSSHADISENPFGARPTADRRLYHRNMSSFEAASLQLEQQQQMKDYGSGDQIDLIAKMTADFQSAIETNDKQFADGCNPDAFDPFMTIVDDDVSIPSQASSFNQGNQEDKLVKSKHENGVGDPSSGQDSQSKTTHDSIDDDEEDLVSTPVRNIKSSTNKVHVGGSSFEDQLDNGSEEEVRDSQPDESNLESTEGLPKHQRKSPDSKEPEITDSMAKASLYASLLATAESSGQQVANVGPTNSRDDMNQMDSDEQGRVTEVAHILENTTHVITGKSHTTRDGNLDRPVSFFDPFETVIEKDALTSLMNDSQQQPFVTKYSVDDDPDNSTTDIIESTQLNSGRHHDLQLKDSIDHRSGLKAESTSIETVIDSVSSRLGESNSMAISEKSVKNQYDVSNVSALPRPQKSTIEDGRRQQNLAHLPQEISKTTPAKKSQKPKKKPSFQEDSSDSSEDDDRIQIVIKARNESKIERQSGPTIVPLLPPPPSKNSMKQARERGQVDDIPSPVMSYKTRHGQKVIESDSFENMNDKVDSDTHNRDSDIAEPIRRPEEEKACAVNNDHREEDEDEDERAGQFVIPMVHSDDDGDGYGKPDTPLYDEDTSYVLEEFPVKYEGPGWEMMLRYPPKKKLTSNRFWKKIFVKLAQVPLAPETRTNKQQQPDSTDSSQTCIALQIYDKPDDKKPMQEIPIHPTYTVSEISSQQFDQFGKIFTIKLQYIFYKERVGVRQGQLARFIHSGHIGSSTTSGGHGVDPISIGAIKRAGAPIEHSPQISQIIKLGCTSYSDIKQFKNCLEDYLFKMPIHRDRALSTYKTEEVQMAVRDETYLELNQVGTIIRQLARVRLFFLSFLNGTPTVEVGINDIHRQGREVVGRMDILPVVTEEWIRLEAWELHSTVEKEDFENPNSRIIKLVPPDATFFELMRFRVRPPRNRELPLQISANMSVTRTKVSINCEVMVPGCVSRKHGQIPCENIAIKVFIPECWIYFFREEKHFRMGSKKSVNRRPGKVKGIERFLGGGGLQDINDESSLIEVTSGQAKYEHHHQAIVWRAARWPKESQSAYVQNTMKIRLPLTAYDKMPETFYDFVHVEYTMPATTVSHTTLRSISVNPCDDEPPEKYVKYSAKYEYKVKMRLSINFGSKVGETKPEASPIIIMKQPDLHGDLQREEDSDDDDDRSDVEDANHN